MAGLDAGTFPNDYVEALEAAHQEGQEFALRVATATALMSLARRYEDNADRLRELLGEVRLPIHQEHVNAILTEVLTRDVDKMLEACEKVDRVAYEMENGTQAA
jgi:hypothetical protein